MTDPTNDDLEIGAQDLREDAALDDAQVKAPNLTQDPAQDDAELETPGLTQNPDLDDPRTEAPDATEDPALDDAQVEALDLTEDPAQDDAEIEAPDLTEDPARDDAEIEALVLTQDPAQDDAEIEALVLTQDPGYDDAEIEALVPTQDPDHDDADLVMTEDPPVVWMGLMKLLAILAGIAILVYIASWSRSWYHDLSRQAENAGVSGLREEAETATAWATKPGSESETGPCPQLLDAAAGGGEIRRSGDFLSVATGQEAEPQAWYVGAQDGRLARDRLAGILEQIRCYQGWRLPTVAELRALTRQLPPEMPALPEGLWTAEDDGLGTEWKVYFPASDDFDFRGGAYTWWLIAVTDAPTGPDDGSS